MATRRMKGLDRHPWKLLGTPPCNPPLSHPAALAKVNIRGWCGCSILSWIYYLLLGFPWFMNYEPSDISFNLSVVKLIVQRWEALRGHLASSPGDRQDRQDGQDRQVRQVRQHRETRRPDSGGQDIWVQDFRHKLSHKVWTTIWYLCQSLR